MQITASLLASMALLTSVALAAPSVNLAARNTSSSLSTKLTETYCRLDFHYCGWNLIEHVDANYKARISNKLCSITGDCDPNSPEIWNSLWNCGADLEYIAVCGGAYSCADGGAGDDYCS